ncbi:Extracellular ligand-binding receptor [Artemisia annua]|uniref:Extracellular ligand-binding receptor n=1 Tax=Artemisia annua TaxID=35608 RepID=A0A2U1MGP7_ARTAN|nr:Extracellular ligand-binding receptor [Artemisia annua]
MTTIDYGEMSVGYWTPLEGIRRAHLPTHLYSGLGAEAVNWHGGTTTAIKGRVLQTTPTNELKIGAVKIKPFNNFAFYCFVCGLEIDAVVGDSTILPNRSEYVDFTTTHSDLDVGTVGKIKEPDMWFFLEPLHWGVWLSAIGSLITTCISSGGFIVVSRYASSTHMPPSILSRGIGWQHLFNLPNFKGHLSMNIDVYSFGVVLFELLSGRRAIAYERCVEETSVEWVKPFLRDNRGVLTIKDTQLGVLHEIFSKEFMLTLLKVQLSKVSTAPHCHISCVRSQVDILSGRSSMALRWPVAIDNVVFFRPVSDVRTNKDIFFSYLF